MACSLKIDSLKAKWQVMITVRYSIFRLVDLAGMLILNILNSYFNHFGSGIDWTESNSVHLLKHMTKLTRVKYEITDFLFID